MNNIKHFIFVSSLALGLTAPAIASEPGHMEHAAASAAAETSLTDGEIKKVDKTAGKVTIKHGDIKHLDMPGMTMVFTAKDKGLLTNLQPGDKVKFMVVNDGGKMVITEIKTLAR